MDRDHDGRVVPPERLAALREAFAARDRAQRALNVEQARVTLFVAEIAAEHDVADGETLDMETGAIVPISTQQGDT